MAQLFIRFTPASLRKIDALVKRIEKAKAFGQDRMELTRGMRDDQTKAWMKDFDNTTKRYGGTHSTLSPVTVRNRIRRGFPAGPPLKRSGNMKGDVEAQSRRGINTHNGVLWSFVDRFGASDNSLVPVHQNQFRTFWGLEESKDLEVHKERVDAWLGKLGGIVRG